MNGHSPERIGRAYHYDEWAAHAEAAIDSGNVEKYAKSVGVSATRLSGWMSENGFLETMQTNEAARNLIGLRHAINAKGRLASGYNETIGAIQREVLRMIVTQNEDGQIDTLGILNLSKAAKLHTDSLLTILGDPTTIQAVNVTVATSPDEETAHYQILERIAAKAANRADAIEAVEVRVEDLDDADLVDDPEGS